MLFSHISYQHEQQEKAILQKLAQFWLSFSNSSEPTDFTISYQKAENSEENKLISRGFIESKAVFFEKNMINDFLSLS